MQPMDVPSDGQPFRVNQRCGCVSAVLLPTLLQSELITMTVTVTDPDFDFSD